GLAEPQVIQHMHGVGAQLNAGTDFRQFRRLLEDLDFMAGLEETTGCRETPYSSASNCNSFRHRPCPHPNGVSLKKPREAPLKRDEIGLNRHRALALCLSMIFSENRFTLFRIMLLGNTARLPQFRTMGKVPTQPRAAIPVQFLDLGPGQAWHVTFHTIADCLLRICKMAIADRKSVQ